ncbi:MAG: hypothetical protein K6D57_02340 [Paludibacteraceae bacterium]|jgi:hypothetical protein|nr:hypothetical protein [Paludibacteraceae bacterium]MCR5298116.1 hypothetical protein [Paludibacteraceae bacterium]
MEKISKYVLWVLLALSVVLVFLFYAVTGDDTIDVAGDSFSVPTFTNPVLFWSYILVAFVSIATIVAVVKQYMIKFKTDKTSAIRSLLYAAGLIVLLLITFLIGSGEKLDIIGYEGTDNVGFWAQFTDMCLYTVYVLSAIAFLGIVASFAIKFIKK